MARVSGFVDRVAGHPLADPVGHVAMALTRGTDVDPHALFGESGIEVLARHGLLDAAAREGPLWLRNKALPVHVRSVARREFMSRHTDLLSADLADRGIDSVVLKGRAAARFYRDPSVRPWTDIDLLVRPEQVQATLDVLSTYPYTRDIPPQGPEADKRHIMLGEGPIYFTLDLHWHLFSYHQLRGRADVALSEVWESTVTENGTRRLALDAELAFFATHALLDHRFRLILFRDLAEMIRSADVDWERLAHTMDRWGLRSVVWAALSCAEAFAGAAVQAGFLDTLAVGSLPERLFSSQLASIDPVRFDGHRVHPLNLASVLLHDDRGKRLRLAARAPQAYGGWQKRTEIDLMKPPRRALILVTSNQRRGAEVYGEVLADRLRGHGWDSTLMCLWEGDGPTIAAAPVTTGASPPNRLHLRTVIGLARRIAEYDVVLANGSATLVHTFLASLLVVRSPAIVYSSIGEPAYWAPSRLRRRLQRWMLSRFDLVTAVSHETERQLVELIGLDPTAVLYAPTGVAEAPVVQEPRTSGPLRAVFIGSLTPEKRPGYLLEALSQLSEGTVEVRMIGDGPLAGELDRTMHRLGVNGQVTLVGAVDRVDSHLGWADVLIQTSESEGLPGVIMEAAALGVPSVAFDVGGTGELIIDGETGWLCRPDRVTTLATRLRELADDPDVLAAVGQAAKDYVGRHFTLEASVDAYDRALSEAIRRRRGQ